MKTAIDNLYSDFRKSMPAASSNQKRIKAVKEIAKQHKLLYAELLKLYTPDNNIDKDKTWDKNGNIK